MRHKRTASTCRGPAFKLHLHYLRLYRVLSPRDVMPLTLPGEKIQPEEHEDSLLLFLGTPVKAASGKRIGTVQLSQKERRK